MDHIIYKNILGLLEEQHILTILQHEFRIGFSCETWLIATIDLMQYRDKYIQVDMTIFDFSKAFDTVPHNKPLYKLKHYGLNSNRIKWIGNFLKQRSQRVVVDGKHSSWTHVDTGVQ